MNSSSPDNSQDPVAAHSDPAEVARTGTDITDALDPGPLEVTSDRAAIIGHDGRWLSGWALRFIVLAVAAYLLWMGVGAVWVGVLPAMLALLLSTVLNPLVQLFTRKLRLPHTLSVLVTMIGSVSAIGAIFAVMAPSVAGQSQDLYDRGVAGFRTLIRWIEGPPFNVDSTQLNNLINSALAKLQEQISNIASSVASGVSTASSVLATLGIMLVLTFFFLKDGAKFLPWVTKHVGANAGFHFNELFTRTWNTLGGFIRAQAIVSLIDAVFIGAGLMLLNVPLAFVLAVITFLGGFIPIVGAVSAGALSVLVALVSNGPTTALLVLGLIILVQQLEGNVLSPMLQSKAMDLHPAIILLSVAVGGGLFGIVGAFLAVPVAATIAVWLRYHAQLVSLRAGEITIDDIELATQEEAATEKTGRDVLTDISERFSFKRGNHAQSSK